MICDYQPLPPGLSFLKKIILFGFIVVKDKKKMNYISEFLCVFLLSIINHYSKCAPFCIL